MQLTAKAGGTFPIPGALAFLPLVDYALITDYPSVNLAQGKLADIPVISGNALDEGTLFAQKALNSSADFETWVRSAAVIYNTTYTERALQRVFEVYPDDPCRDRRTRTRAPTLRRLRRMLGRGCYSPLESNQYKRSAAFFGDFTFNAHRRTYLHAAVGAPGRTAATYGRSSSGRTTCTRTEPARRWARTTAPNSSTSSSDPMADRRIRSWKNRCPGRTSASRTIMIPAGCRVCPGTRYTTGEVLQLKGGNVTTVPDTFRKEAMHALTTRALLPCLDSSCCYTSWWKSE